MKRKAIILLSSIMAGSLLVGGVLAATYAVTDNADPLGVKVAMGDIKTDQTTYVTLDWGSSTLLNDVGNLKVGENRVVGVVSLVSTGSNYQGKLQLSLNDITEDKTTTNPYLIDYLNVYVYHGVVELGTNGALPSAQPDFSILKGAAKDEGDDVKITRDFLANGTPAGNEYTIIVNLDNSSASATSSIEKDEVYLKADWNVKSSDDITTDAVIYYAKPTPVNDPWGSKLYAFTWNGDNRNANWPGVEMIRSYISESGQEIYQITVPQATQGYVIFNDDEGGHQTTADGYSFQGYSSDKPFYSETTHGWATKPTKLEINITGTLTRGTANPEALTLNDIKASTSDNLAEYRLDLLAGDKVSFKDGTTDIDFYHYDTSDHNDGNIYTVSENGKYGFYLTKAKHMYVSKIIEVQYHLAGSVNGWSTTDDDYLLDAVENDAGHYKLTNVAFEQGSAFKITDGSQNGWFSSTDPWENCGFTNDTDGNVVVSAAGTYTVDFYRNATNNNYVTITKQQ